jgi:hypothetical protein
MRVAWVLGCCVGLSLAGCSSPTQGPVVHLAEEVAQPQPLPEPPPRPLVPPAGPATTAGTFRAWVLPRTTARGEVIDGHWAILQVTPPPAVRVEPERVVPRAPRVPFVPKPAAKASPSSGGKGAPSAPGMVPPEMQRFYPQFSPQFDPSLQPRLTPPLPGLE